MLTLEKCEFMGANAAMDDCTFGRCPFVAGTEEWHSWWKGFCWMADFLMEDAIDDGLILAEMPEDIGANGKTVH